LAGANIAAQSAPPRSPAQGSSGTPPQAAAKLPGVPAGSPSATPTTEELVNSLGPADLQAAITLLKNNFADLDAITDAELNRAMDEGLLVRMPSGAMLLAAKEKTTVVAPNAFNSELIAGHVAYHRARTVKLGNQ